MNLLIKLLIGKAFWVLTIGTFLLSDKPPLMLLCISIAIPLGLLHLVHELQKEEAATKNN